MLWGNRLRYTALGAFFAACSLLLSSSLDAQEKATKATGPTSETELIGVPWWTNPDWWQIILTGLIALFAAGAAGAAIKAAGVAEDTLEETRDMAKRQLRAYLSLTPARANHHGETFSIGIMQRNNGQTPANNVQFSGVFAVLPHPLQTNRYFGEPQYCEGTNVIAPGHKFTVSLDYLHVRPEDLDEWRSTNQRLYFIGVLKYEDIYGEYHETRACWSYNPDEITRIIYQCNVLRRKLSEDDQMRYQMIEASFDYTSNHNDAT